MRSSVLVMALVGIVALGFYNTAGAAEKPQQIKVLLITGDDVPRYMGAKKVSMDECAGNVALG